MDAVAVLAKGVKLSGLATEYTRVRLMTDERPDKPMQVDEAEQRAARSERFAQLVALGYSVETSALLADAPVSVEAIAILFEPDAEASS